MDATGLHKIRKFARSHRICICLNPGSMLREGWLAGEYARLLNHRPCNNSTAWSNTANGSAAL